MGLDQSFCNFAYSVNAGTDPEKMGVAIIHISVILALNAYPNVRLSYTR